MVDGPPYATLTRLRGPGVVDVTQQLSAVRRREPIERGLGPIDVSQSYGNVLRRMDCVGASGAQFKGESVADADFGGAAHTAVDVETVSALAHGDQRGPNRRAVERAFYADSPSAGLPSKGAAHTPRDVDVRVGSLLEDRRPKSLRYNFWHAAWTPLSGVGI